MNDAPLLKRQSFWFALLGAIVSTPEAIEIAMPFFPNEWHPALRIISGVCLVIAIQFGRQPGAQARSQLRQRGEASPPEPEEPQP